MLFTICILKIFPSNKNINQLILKIFLNIQNLKYQTISRVPKDIYLISYDLLIFKIPGKNIDKVVGFFCLFSRNFGLKNKIYKSVKSGLSYSSCILLDNNLEY